jgi:thiol-disulfide isomerase/thioredoxin
VTRAFAAWALSATLAAAVAADAGAVSGDAAQALFVATFGTVDGGKATLAELRGRPLIVNFWARWCTPCRAEIPELTRVQRDHPSITVIGVDLDEPPAAVREFARAYEITYRVLLTRGDGIELLQALGNTAASLPFTLAIDRHGTIVGRRLGVLRPADLDALLRRLR